MLYQGIPCGNSGIPNRAYLYNTGLLTKSNTAFASSQVGLGVGPKFFYFFVSFLVLPPVESWLLLL